MFIEACSKDAFICQDFVASVTDEWVCRICGMILTDEKRSLSEINLFHCQYIHHRSVRN